VTGRSNSPAPYPEFDGTELCRDDPALFFPGKGEKSERAIAICDACDWEKPCLAYALTHHEHGVWGGMSEDTRTRAQKRLDITVTAAPRVQPGAPRHLGKTA
jgi:hypothetical protein